MGEGDLHQELGRPSLFHRHLITSGAVLFVYVKLKIKKEREEAGLKERKKKEASEGRER